MRFLFPCDYFDKKKPDDIYESQYVALKSVGAFVSTIDVDNIEESNIVPAPIEREMVIYRGWMLGESRYSSLVAKIIRRSILVEPTQLTD